MSKIDFISIDNGNSNPSFATFFKENLETVYSLADFTKFYSENLTLLKDIPKYLSDVGKASSFINSLTNVTRVSDLKQNRHFLEMPYHYADTIGDDRLVESYYVFRKYVRNEKDPVIFIDCGTFTTINFINDTGYTGGFITPGLKVFFQSYSAGEKLPLINFEEKSLFDPALIGKNTDEAIFESGKLYLRGFYKELLTEFNQYDKIIVTGGMGQIHTRILLQLFPKKTVVFRKHLIHHALNLTYYQNRLKV